MSGSLDQFLRDHERLTRRFFLGLSGAAAATLSQSSLFGAESKRAPKLQEAIDKLESWLTLQDDFRDVSRGKPKPHSLPDEKRKEVGLLRDTWQLEVVSDKENPARLRKEFKKEDNTAFTFKDLMQMAQTRAVRFPKVMTCLNIGCPLGNGIWEGVPLRDVLWLTQPRENLRRVFYEGFHNEDPEQLFQSSLPVGRILEDPFDLPPVVLCYKLNGDWLTPERGGPVRVVVPEGYGFKSIKWLQKITLTNLHNANDTYAKGKNDVDRPLKSFAATLSIPDTVKPNEPIPVTGYAQVGISGVSKVQVWVHDESKELEPGDKYHEKAPWQDAEILDPPAKWGGGLADNRIPSPTMSFDPQTGQPKTWPIRLSKIHWAALLPGLPEGEYTFRSRTVDDKGYGQPLPRPFRKSGHAAIEKVTIRVKA